MGKGTKWEICPDLFLETLDEGVKGRGEALTDGPNNHCPTAPPKRPG